MGKKRGAGDIAITRARLAHTRDAPGPTILAAPLSQAVTKYGARSSAKSRALGDSNTIRSWGVCHVDGV